jgi:hypothetical protein
MGPLQEKFQITVPGKSEDEGGWVNPTHVSKPVTKFNVVPDNNVEGTKAMPLSLAGATDISCGQLSAESVSKGFEKIEMKSCDDQYTGEHVDHFYGDAGGFAERNNYLDRM